MDDNTRQVLVAAITVAGGLLTGLVVAFLGFRYARNLERDRWAREDRIRADELERARVDRWRDRRREVCVETLSTAFALEQMAQRVVAGQKIPITDWTPLLDRGWAAIAELRLISEDLASIGGALLAAANDIWVTATTKMSTESGVDPVEAYGALLARFVDAAQADLAR